MVKIMDMRRERHEYDMRLIDEAVEYTHRQMERFWLENDFEWSFDNGDKIPPRVWAHLIYLDQEVKHAYPDLNEWIKRSLKFIISHWIIAIGQLRKLGDKTIIQEFSKGFLTRAFKEAYRV